MNDELEDELGSQKLLVKNHCSTNQHADGFRDPRQDVGQQKQSNRRATRDRLDQVTYGSRAADSEPDVLFLPGLKRTRRRWISIISTTLPIHKSQLREIFVVSFGWQMKCEWHESWTWKIIVLHCLAFPMATMASWWKLCWNQLKGKHATYSPSIFAIGSSTNLW